MPLEITPVSQLHSHLSTCKVKVRIARLWAYHKKDRPKDIMGIDLLLVDDKVLSSSLYRNFFVNLLI